MKIKEAISLGEKGVISIIGAGGKTSLMYVLADELASAGKKVLTTTTTKIFMPTHEESSATIIARAPEEIIAKARALIQRSPHLTLGAQYLPATGKLVGVSPEVLENILETDLFDYIIIEADGAARRSLKACSDHEPVVPRFTDSIVSLAGLDAIGRPLEEQWVFRADLFSSITHLPLNEKITAASVAEILIHDTVNIATAKKDIQRIAFLNKADDRSLLETGITVAAILERTAQNLFQRVVIGVLRDEPVIHQCNILSCV